MENKELASVEEVYLEDGIFKFKMTEEMKNSEENYLIRVFEKMKEATTRGSNSLDVLLGDLGYDIENRQDLLWSQLYSYKMMPENLHKELDNKNGSWYEEFLDANIPCIEILYGYATTHGQTPKEFLNQFESLINDHNHIYIQEFIEKETREMQKYEEKANTSQYEKTATQDEPTTNEEEDLKKLLDMVGFTETRIENPSRSR